MKAPPSSRYEANILAQPDLLRKVLAEPLPDWMPRLRGCPIHFVGVGSSYHAAEIAKALWRRLAGPRAEAAHSFEFARLPQPVGRGDVVAVLSHRGGNSFTVEAGRLARKAGAATVAITGRGASWREAPDHRIDCCELEDTGAFTKSLTTTLAWIARWIGAPDLLDGLRRAEEGLRQGPEFPKLSAGSDLVLVGDLEREWVARETALKLLETSFIKARAFGLEEFLHGPQLSVGKGTTALLFCGAAEPRAVQARRYLKGVGARVVEVHAPGLPADAAWLGQLLWGQRLAADACRRLGVDPDDNRRGDERYRKALAAIGL
ncbi:MAG: SIS domain-containing protein [Elusimicrobia bacterium]|nr:SIS domain-containing protein [Elusimicrobiota bacterium]MDE2236528.1 SIS domain-containing protein [Elusimicrobiota bacterium]MDE2426422.1 SIS domain-containing protein [Elusimicrobiota bacterium]